MLRFIKFLRISSYECTLRFIKFLLLFSCVAFMILTLSAELISAINKFYGNLCVT